jgi:predicted nucleic acid-binding protein
MVVIDTDVLLLAFAFQSDERQEANTEFLKRAQTAEPSITIYNLMELLGLLSFNLAPSRLAEWESWLIDAYRLTVIWPLAVENQSADTFFRTELFDRPYAKMSAQRMALMDALVLDLAERTPDVKRFVTWNARHFKSKSALTVLTPTEYLAQNV